MKKPKTFISKITGDELIDEPITAESIRETNDRMNSTPEGRKFLAALSIIFPRVQKPNTSLCVKP